MSTPRHIACGVLIVALLTVTTAAGGPVVGADQSADTPLVVQPECDSCDYPCPTIEYGAWFVPGGDEVLHAWNGCIYDVEENPCNDIIPCNGFTLDAAALDMVETLVERLATSNASVLAHHLLSSGYDYVIDDDASVLRINGCRGAMIALLPIPDGLAAAMQEETRSLVAHPMD
jgi:hypothetical protein